MTVHMFHKMCSEPLVLIHFQLIKWSAGMCNQLDVHENELSGDRMELWFQKLVNFDVHL